MSNSDTNAPAAALGSIIGYLGAEVAEPSVFERLLWPQRHYNYFTRWTVIKMAVMAPMGGPLHKAALVTLDAFRLKGLYRGTQQGHMLGTAFFPDLKTKYKIHNYHGFDVDDEVRNGLWVTVMRRASQLQVNPAPTIISKSDSESAGGQPVLVRRTSQVVQHLKLSRASANEIKNEKLRVFTEEGFRWHVILGIPASEITAIGCAIFTSIKYHTYWFAAFLLVPMLFKLLALTVSVRREPMNAAPEVVDEKSTVLFQILDYDHGFPLIEGPEDVVRPFFRHWGHPIRQNGRDRFREVCGIALVVGFVLYFPVGLLSMLWVNQPIQIMWVSYQMYTIIVMHISRLRGEHGEGRIEDGIAEELVNGKKIALYTKEQGYITAYLERTFVGRIAHGQDKVEQIISEHAGI